MPATAIGKPVSPLLRPGGIATGLALGLPLTDGGGTTVQDYSGNGNTGTLHGGATWTSGPWGRCLSFDGATGYVSGSMSGVGATAVTIALWGLPSGSAEYVLDFGPDATDSRSILYGFQSGAWNVYRNGYPTGTASDTQMAASGGRDHVVYTTDGSTLQGYLNGRKLVDVSANLNRSAPTAFSLGRPLGVDANYYTGTIDALSIFGRALSAAEVAALYADSFQMYRPRRRTLKGAAAVGGAGFLLRRRRMVGGLAG